MSAINENTDRPATAPVGLAAIAQALVAPLTRMIERRRTAQTFAAMSDRLLMDIGLDRSDVDAAVSVAHPGSVFEGYVDGIRDTIAATAKAWATDAALHDVPPHLRRDIGVENENDTIVAELMSAYRLRVEGRVADPLIENIRISNDISRRVA